MISARGASLRVSSRAAALSDPPEQATTIIAALAIAPDGEDGFTVRMLWRVQAVFRRTRFGIRPLGATGDALDLAARLALFDRFAFVVLFFPASESELNFDEAAFEIDAQRHERQSLFLQIGHGALDLAAVEQQFSIAPRFVLRKKR